MENQTGGASQTQTDATSKIKKMGSVKISKKTILFIIIVLVILGAVFYFKSLFIAAVVDGKPISRLEVIRELENTSGRQVLDALVVKQLIDTEANKAEISVSQEDIETEIQTLEERISKQGGTLELILAQQGITQDQFREQIVLQKKLEKILENNIQITDEEINQYFEQSKTTLPAGATEDEIKNQIRAQLKNQKFGIEADKLVSELKAKAAIQYYVGYGKPEPELISEPESKPASESTASTETPADTQNSGGQETK